MSSKKIFVVFLILALGAFGGYAAWTLRTSNEPQTETAADTTSTPSDSNAPLLNGDTAASDSITREDVAQHNTADDCWTIIDGNVYDITSYIPRHPGGDDILRACGTDGSSLFNQRQTADGERIGSGTPHSQSAQSQLEPFLVGSLENS